ncbi:hypothetical protein RB195_008890 [Necator americanus]
MLSKFVGFLSELFGKSRTNQQWERVLGKQLKTLDRVEQTPAVYLKKSTKALSFNTKRVHRTQLPMIVPQNSILLWKDPIDSCSTEKPQCVSLLFDFSHDGSSLLITLRRPLAEPFVETAKRIETKIHKLLAPQKPKKSHATLHTAPSNEFPPVTVEAPEVTKSESFSLEDVMESQRYLIIGGKSYTIIREPIDISTLTCALKPIVGCPIYPAIDFRQGSTTIRPTIHWYVYNQPQEECHESKSKPSSSRENITFLDGPSRRFIVSNCEYRWTGDSYVPSSVDIGKKLFLVADLGPESIVKCGVSKYPIEFVDEPFIFESNALWCQKEKPSKCIRIVSYNILADLYLDLSGPQESLFFPYCPKAYQMYEYRYPLILRELLSYDMDLCFLQEVDHRMQMRYLSALLKSISAEMCFSKKQREVTEGSVIAYRRERFELVFSESYGLASLLETSGSDVKSILSSSATSLEIFASRPTTLQVLVLRDRTSGDLIVCGNTHLHHNPKHEHLKTLQATIAVRQLDSIRKLYSDQNPNVSVRLILAGDFNSTPDGPVYELLSTGILRKSSSCWHLDEDIVPKDLLLLPSGEGLKNLTGTDVTNYTRYTDEKGIEHGFSGCLDYIWTDAIRLHRLAPRPSLELLSKYEALPSKIAPSDHVPLICEVKFSED